MTSTETYNCKNCGRHFTARTADRARGWAKFCSKSCKAIKQTKEKIKKAQRQRPWQRFDRCESYDDKVDLLRNPRIIEPLYTDGERDGEVFFANFSNSEGSDI